jgi:hypothetical protein
MVSATGVHFFVFKLELIAPANNFAVGAFNAVYF